MSSSLLCVLCVVYVDLFFPAAAVSLSLLRLFASELHSVLTGGKKGVIAYSTATGNSRIL